MKILINTSNLKKGGALQVAHSFLTEIKENTENEFHVVLSSTLSKQINEKEYSENFKFYHYSINSNILNTITGKNKFLTNLENQVTPDCIFTVFGPAYWSSKSKHILGFADGWCYNPDSIAFKKNFWLTKQKIKALIKFKNFRIKKEADILIVETSDAKQKISKYLNIDEAKLKVVSNTYHEIFNSHNFPNFRVPPKKENEFRFVTISANYLHKNLDIIKQVIPVLKAKKLNVSFWLTIPDKEFRHTFFGFDKWIKNIGPVDINFVPSLYNQCDALFLPTLLETFTASYPEAMKMGKPILTSDLSFAHDICGNAAEYFNPLDTEDIANKIEQIIIDYKRRELLVKNGYIQLNKFETSKSRAEKYLKICQEICQQP